MKKLFILLVLFSSVLFANIGTVMALKGQAQVQRASGNVDVASGMELLEGDTIVTQSKSRVQVMLKDETVVTVGSKSTFSFDEYSFDGENSKVSMKSSRGFFRSVTGRIGKLAPQRFKVKTASATIGIRGTDFWGITGGESEKVTCNKGAITIEYDGKTIEVGAGRYAIYGPKGIKEGKADSGSAGSGDDAKEGDEEDSEDEESDESSSDTPNPLDEFGSVDVPTEDIADVTQQTLINALEVLEAFGITVNTQDRPVEY